MTNYELWRIYTSRLHSPKQFLDAAFYYMVGAAMERRVWLGSGHASVFPNQYVLLCAKAGVGKGLATGAAKTILNAVKDPKYPDKPFLSTGPDSGSYEKLAHKLADNVRTTYQGSTYITPAKEQPYAYSCIRMELDEFISFFHKEATNAVKFFCSMWTGTDYNRDTFSHGEKALANPLLSFIAGCTPDDVRTLRKYDVVGTGLDRRLIVVYAEKNEFEQFLIPEASKEAIEAAMLLAQHVKKLTEICGKVSFTPEAKALGQAYWIDKNKTNVNHHSICESYNDNKQPQWQKYAIAMHFAEGEPAEKLVTPISAETLEAAIRQLHSYEMLRHFAYEQSAPNMISVAAGGMLNFVKKRGTVDQKEIIDRFFADWDMKQINEALEYLELSGRIKQDGTKFSII